MKFLKPRPSNEHLGDKVERFRITALVATTSLLLLVTAELLLWARGRLSSSQLMVALLLINPLIVYSFSRIIEHLSGRMANEFILTLLAGRGGDRKHEFSLVESMIVRGRFAEAADELRAHLVAYPDDVDAMIRLATLTTDHLGDQPAAVELFLKALELSPDRGEQNRIGNGLIDLYRSLGNQQALELELGRFKRETRNGRREM